MFLDREKSAEKLEVTESDRISIYLELIDLLQQVDKGVIFKIYYNFLYSLKQTK